MRVYQEMTTAMPHDLINAKPVMAAIQRVLRLAASSRSSWTRPTRCRRSRTSGASRRSGPGGLSRERAGFEVRDVHPTHYGRICPIETPEGPNIGLISSLVVLRAHQRVRLHRDARTARSKSGTRARLLPGHRRRATPTTSSATIVESDEMAERTTRSKAEQAAAEVEPYCFYLSAWEEDKYIIAQANVKLDRRRRHRRRARHRPRRRRLHPRRPRQGRVHRRLARSRWSSVAAALIPFLEHDDANRALMGSNMQRQAVPLLRTEPPIVGTGLEHITVAGLRRHGRRAGAPASSTRRRRAHHRARRGAGRTRRARRSAPTSTSYASSVGSTRAPASTRSRSSSRPAGRRRARSSPTGRAPTRASWPSAATCWSRSCRGTATTSKTRSSSPRSW